MQEQMLSDKKQKKQFKQLASQEPDKYYATGILREKGFMRKQCKCGIYFWSVNPEQEHCGDSVCCGGFGCSRHPDYVFAAASKTACERQPLSGGGPNGTPETEIPQRRKRERLSLSGDPEEWRLPRRLAPAGDWQGWRDDSGHAHQGRRQALPDQGRPETPGGGSQAIDSLAPQAHPVVEGVLAAIIRHYPRQAPGGPLLRGDVQTRQQHAA